MLLVVAGTEPNDFTPSDLMAGVAAGDDEMGAEASSIEPNVTAEPCFTAPTLFLGMLTPSFMGTPWPRALGRREWVRWGAAVVEGLAGAGDCDRGDGAVALWGGPFAQADFCGSGIFGNVAVEDLLIEWSKR
jgi:hypothetical protein